MKIASILSLACLLTACVKTHPAPGTASLNIINTVDGSTILIPDFDGNIPLSTFGTANQFSYASFYPYSNQLSGYVGIQHLTIYRIEDTGAHATPLFDLTLTLPVGSIHTLFLTGTVASPDTLFTTDTLPYHADKDSAVGVRFVNLSQGSDPVTVAGIGRLAYKDVSGFKSYPAASGSPDPTFTFFDATGTPVASYTLTGVSSNDQTNTWRNRNVTIALYGRPGAQAAMLINDY